MRALLNFHSFQQFNWFNFVNLIVFQMIPDSKNPQFPPLPAGIVMQGQMEPITEDEIKTIILRIKKAKSPGEDGITGQHLKYLVYQHKPFLKILEFFFNQLLNNPHHLQDCKKLFRFRALLIPKKTGGFRPVSCESMILCIFFVFKNEVDATDQNTRSPIQFQERGQYSRSRKGRILQSSRKNANSGRLYKCVLGYRLKRVNSLLTIERGQFTLC
ncbi:Reverse_transcriptase (RNA-dependent DNA polymerase) [Hexamita inflata]|uniref:Reverse_transcriptase (RNA-dependent DNA polymerase) n=1 Tax=Hexamita inflata TaxID=28002 RepID=A0ABP1H3Z7_9EUKA